ncbi:unnamed protein product [Medioppia subpectinata]|uniref:Uncharacterized protein n=1 Tax=Medioppia subpectinata TaxID=1979941 RepID=A0A7R9L3I5_9ACAR|nr:unnamed protein product [Medioppia subpectinata]CAG2114751.1 unnamed protein product [Medioppia subpectinata]
MSAKQEIRSSSAPNPVGTYSQAIRVGNTVYLSGQVSIDPKSGQVVLESFEAQAEQVFNNLRAVAEASGATLDHIVKLTIFIKDFKHFPTVNQTMEKYFKKPFPARSTIGVSSLPLGVDIEVEAIIHL